jgi:hypothetical protein
MQTLRIIGDVGILVFVVATMAGLGLGCVKTPPRRP